MYNQTFDLAKMICTFIDPKSADKFFSSPETVENTGFMADLMKIDPNIDMSNYDEILNS